MQQCIAESNPSKLGLLGLIPIGIGGLPPIRVRAHLLQPARGRPAQLLQSPGRVRVADSDVPRPALPELEGQRVPRGLLHGRHHVQHAVASARAQVEHRVLPVPVGLRGLGRVLRVRLHVLERGDVPLGQVHHVDIVAHACAVLRGIVFAKNGQLFPAPDDDLVHVGHEVIGDAVGVLADAAGGVRAHWVEVAQNYHAPGVVGYGMGQVLGRFEVLQDLLDHELRAPVGVGDTKPSWGVFRDRHFGGPVHGGGGGEDDGVAAVQGHQVQQVDRSADVVLVV
mmetsp:Transcript_9861/g.21966  ORF Transcript_9861/g.21966 Transcript_9861/m.21966 type:complete len:281 (-) Transcript_9861:409-1251(-)